jgi:hypothetical protein
MIELLNCKPGDIITHSIAYLFGYCKTSALNSIIETIDQNGIALKWSIVNNYFKVKFNLCFFSFLISNKYIYINIIVFC